MGWRGPRPRCGAQALKTPVLRRIDPELSVEWLEYSTGEFLLAVCIQDRVDFPRLKYDRKSVEAEGAGIYFISQVVSWASMSDVLWRTGLNDEVGNNSMKTAAVVVTQACCRG